MKRRLIYPAVGLCGFVVALTLISRDGLQVPSYREVKSNYLPSDARLLDRHGELLQELRIDLRTRRLEWTSMEEVPPHFLRALLYEEDRRFYRHHGVDWIALANGVLHTPLGHTRGASTITMQLVAHLDPLLNETKGKRRSWNGKLRQIREALALERVWSKTEILEGYLNLSFFRGELQGLRAAAQGLFQKSPDGLSFQESAVVAALLQWPGAPEERIAQRACRLARAIETVEDCRPLQDTVKKAFGGTYRFTPGISLAPHVARQLLKKGEASTISTLEKSVQAFALETLRRQLMTLEGKNVRDGAVLVLENKTGDVLAYVGNSGDPTSFHVDGVRAQRQAGSALKPFLYALAFQDRLLTPSSYLNDSPVEIPVSGGLYRPKNYDNAFHGIVTARDALASSINVPAVKTLQLVGVDRFVSKLDEMGFQGLHASEFYGPSLALGSADVSLWDLTNAYRTFSRAGLWSQARLRPSESPLPKARIFSEEASFLIGTILSNRESRSLTFGLGSPLAGRSWFAVKTGTSKDMRDNWCIGYSDRYTVGVWVGNFSGEPMWDISGVSGAAPIFSEIMNGLHKDEPSRKPTAPSGVVRAGQGESSWFLVGTEPKGELRIAKPLPRITYPASDTVFAWDPDIPSDRQKVLFEAQSYDPSWEWCLNDRRIASATGPRAWPLRGSGEYVLSLVDDKDRVLDKVSFQVRGGRDNVE